MRLVEQLKVPVHVRSESEYEQMLRTQGFVDVAISHIPNLDASPGGSSFASDDELREFQRIGALLLVARKP